MKNIFPMLGLTTFFLVGCNSYSMVVDEYKNNNANAKEILLGGFSNKESSYIHNYIVERALQGDKEAKQMIYSQIKTIKQ